MSTETPHEVEAARGSGPTVPLRRAVPEAYLVLQGAGAGLLALLVVAVQLLRSLVSSRWDDFGTSWTAVFILVPTSFVPALVWWNGWVVRKFGKRPQAWRFTAEVAFALQVIFCLLVLDIA